MKPAPPKSNLTVIADSFKNTGPNSPVFQPALDMLGIDRRSLEIVTSIQKQPKFMLVLGDDALSTFSTIPCKVSEVRGFVLDSNLGCPMIATYSPWQLANGGYGTLLGVFLRDIRTAMRFATHGVPEPMETNYDYFGTRVRDYISFLHGNRDVFIALDVETAHILGEKEGECPSERRVVQIQFSSKAGTAIVLPWPSEEALEILALPNIKLTWNGRLFDIPVLKAQGAIINGECHDAMLMWSHLQPGFMSSKDDTSGDKGVPAKLMGLQSCLSFYYPAEMPWKGILEKVKTAGYDFDLALRHYGTIDADMTLRLGLKLMDALKKGGLWDGYVAHKLKLGLVLDDLSLRGLPVDRDKQTSLRNYITAEESRLTTELQALIPTELLPVKTYAGWPKDLRAALATAGALVRKTSPLLHWEGYRDVFEGLDYTIRDGVLVKLLPFNPGSSPQLLSYIRYRIEEEFMLDSLNPHLWFMPKHVDTGKDTTTKGELEKLVEATGDPALKLVGKIKKLTKLFDYCGGQPDAQGVCTGSWVPEDDGRVHTTFRFGSATGQTSATNPPIQTYPKHYNPEDLWIKDIMDRVKGCIVAPVDYVMVEIDMTGFHGRMQGFLAEDADYYRLAAIDLHSYNTALYVNEPDKDTMLELSDEELTVRLGQVKSEHKHTRDYMVKRVSFLNQYGGGSEKASRILGAPREDIQRLMDTMSNRFPKTFKDYPASVAKQLRKYPCLRTPFNCIRWIWDQDILQGTAFGPSNCAHCHIQLALIRLHERGALSKYGAVNFMHDSCWYCCREELAMECVAVTREEFERPSDILINSLGAFWCGSDASIGPDMSNMMKASKWEAEYLKRATSQNDSTADTNPETSLSLAA